MPIQLIPMTSERFPAWLERTRVEYEAELVASGGSPEVARRHAVESGERAFPAGVPVAGHAVFDVVDEAGAAVGYLWVGPDASGDAQAWWIWDIVVDSAQRSKGIGRATMRLAEEYARSHGARTLGLSVFGFNDTARGLYESLGYETTTVKMRKKL